MKVTEASVGRMGFDCDQPLSATAAKAFRDAGYEDVLRYVGRSEGLDPVGDLTAAEVEVILAAGLGLMVVQHAPEPGWLPSAGLGAEYGAAMVANLMACGIPRSLTGLRMTAWWDHEGEALGTPPAETIKFINAWTVRVQDAGFQAGIYVGYDCGLTGPQLYRDLMLTRYWRSPSAVPTPLPRGWCMSQGLRTADQVIAGVEFDKDYVFRDMEQGLPNLLVAG